MSTKMVSAVYKTPIGFVKIEHLNNKLSLLKILTSEPKEFGEADSYSDYVMMQLLEYLKGERKTFDVEIEINSCTQFQKSVLNELRNIPYGQTRSYKQIATLIGNPKASRAVGMANNKNQIHIIIPCHRVVGTKGDLTGYASGVEIKKALLSLESNSKNSSI